MRENAERAERSAREQDEIVDESDRVRLADKMKQRNQYMTHVIREAIRRDRTFGRENFSVIRYGPKCNVLPGQSPIARRSQVDPSSSSQPPRFSIRYSQTAETFS